MLATFTYGISVFSKCPDRTVEVCILAVGIAYLWIKLTGLSHSQVQGEHK